MKYLLLDVKNREIKTVEANGLDDYYKIIGCRTIDIVNRIIGDVRVEIVIDDEGALVKNPKVSAIGIDGTPMLCGNLLIASGRVTDDGAMGLNLQKANKIIYFTPPLSSELFEQSKKRIHRIGQEQPCFYYQLISGIEQRIYDTLSMRKDYTDKLFEEEEI